MASASGQRQERAVRRRQVPAGHTLRAVCLQLKHTPPYGFLYHKQLQSLFRQCGQVKSIVFDGAK